MSAERLTTPAESGESVARESANYLRELLDKAERVDVDHVENAHAWRVGDVTIVTDTRDEVVQTVFEKEPEGRGR